LLPCTPSYKITTKENCISTCGSSIIWTTSPVASEKALTNVESELTNFKPRVRVYFKYRRILLTAVQCTVVGACKNWQTLLTEKEISGLVRVTYCRAPTMLLYLVALMSTHASVLVDSVGPPSAEVCRIAASFP
jgi:hypothetical protein